MSDTQLTAKQRAQLQRNVLRGVKLLDRKDPHWYNGGGESKQMISGMTGHIDLGTLDLSRGMFCVLGQRHEGADYSDACNKLGLGGGDEGILKQERHGFEMYDRDDGYSERFSYLTELWAAVISARRDAKSRNNRLPFVKLANKEWKRPRRRA